MSFYLDASAAVSIILQDAHTAGMETWLTRVEEAIVVSDLAALEVAAVVSRQVRMGRMAPPEGLLALSLFDEWAARTSLRIEASAADVALADCFVRDFSTKLAGPDALHLAIVSNRALSLVTFDHRLAEAGRMKSLHVLSL